MVKKIFPQSWTVKSLAEFVERCIQERNYPLNVSPQFECRPNHVGDNYKSAVNGREEVMNTVRKRVHRGQTMGPYYNLDATALPLPHYAINSMGAVPKKDCDDLRCVDDVKANDMTTPPPFKYPSMEWLRATALPGGYWWLVDIRDAFANLPLSPQDKRWLLFRWYDVEDLKFSGTPHDCLYFIFTPWDTLAPDPCHACTQLCNCMLTLQLLVLASHQ